MTKQDLDTPLGEFHPMTESFSIRSVRSTTELKFEVKAKDQYQITLQHPAFNVTKDVWEYSEGNQLSELFLKLGQRQSPWKDAVVWNSIDPEFSLEFRCDRLGHVTIGIKLWKYAQTENWKIEAEIVTELGQLITLGNSAAHFFQAVRSSTASFE